MREIKFRAWIIQEQRMADEVYDLEFQHNRIKVDHEDLDGTYTYLSNIRNKKPRFILMQYVGLKDKLGNDVYEGDIIEFDKYEWYRSPVKSREDIDKLPIYREEISMNHEGVSRSKNDLEQYCEVIGNIYENPELLEAQKG